MSEITITSAQTTDAVDAVRQLCRDFVADQIATHPAHRAGIEAYFGSSQWAQTLGDLPRLHARPGGDMLLACRGPQPVGCIMYLRALPGVAEVKRLFVSPSARGLGVGKALVAECLAGMVADGYRSARLETATFLTQAQALYRGFGFSPVPLFHDHSPDVAAISRAFARDLVP